MKDVLLVDGYNILHASNKWLSLVGQNLEHARLRLVDELLSYGAWKGWHIVLVFDAHAVIGGTATVEEREDVEVVFTAEKQTADSWIERRAADLMSRGQVRVYVATSDYAEQKQVFSCGALRMPARELLEEIDACRRATEDYNGTNILNKRRHTVDNRVPAAIRDKLEQWRKSPINTK